VPRGKARHANRLGRRRAQLEPYDRVLLLCVGRTERVYFEEMTRELSLSNLNIQIRQDAEGQDPGGMIRTAINLRQTEKKLGNDFESIWAVFDRDRFDQFESAIEQAHATRVQVAWSVPCFEYWLLLHFEWTDAPFRATGGLTGAQCCESRLRQHLPDYKKGGPICFHGTWSRVADAIRHAKRRLDDPDWRNEKNPSTNAHELVAYLMGLKPNR